MSCENFSGFGKQEYGEEPCRTGVPRSTNFTLPREEMLGLGVPEAAAFCSVSLELSPSSSSANKSCFLVSRSESDGDGARGDDIPLCPCDNTN